MVRYRVRELNVIIKKGRPGDIRVAIAYPSTYEVALASLSYQMLYYYVNSREGFIGERFVIQNLQGPEPLALSIETGTPLDKFDVVLFSVHYEPDYVNILRLLRAGGVPLKASERRGKPLVVVGGPPVIANPEPLAEFVDVVVIGEIESTLPTLLDTYLELGDNYTAFLDALRPEQGFYTPPLGKPSRVTANYAVNLSLDFHPIAQIQPLDKEPAWGRGTRVETSRGCYRNCAFCMEGRIFCLYRERPLDQIVRIAVEGSKVNATNRVIFVALSFFDHSRAKEILARMVEEGLKFSVPSLRAETLDEEALGLILSGGQKTLTIAPETASVNLALKLRKVVPRSRVEEVALAARKLGFKSIKLYFMIGVPSETISDVKAIVDYVASLSECSGFKGTRELKVTVSPLVPKPHTPLQLVPMISVEEARRRIAIIKKGLSGIAEVRAYDPRWAKVQAILSRGGRELARTLEVWALVGGGLGGWRRAVRETKIRENIYLASYDWRDPLPWDFIKLPSPPRAQSAIE